MRVDARHHWRLVFGKAFVVWQIFGLLRDVDADSCRRCDENEHGRAKPKPKETQEQALAPFALLLGRCRRR